MSADRKRVEYFFIERRTGFLRGPLLTTIVFILVNLQMAPEFNLLLAPEYNQILLYRSVIWIFFNLTIIGSYFALKTFIDPVIRSQKAIGFLGESIKRQERQLGWEILATTTSAYMAIVSIVGPLWVFFDTGYTFQSWQMTLLIILIFFIHVLLILQEDRRLKQLHNYVVDFLTLDDK
ncbi:MAG TPA: hypothetical protein VJ044_01660, partial [Candidatus Hodarchaeales archaeon]|nr:hypothetical protein [Candidatus Hodarchaeales archaeon]